MIALDRWLDHAVIPISRLDPGNAEIVFLGELNHFVHEKTDFRLLFANHFSQYGFDVFAEELGWSDGMRLDEYFRTRDESIFDRVSLFGYRGDARSDRDDKLTGVFGAAADSYPHAFMRAEQTRFYRCLKARSFFGLDVAAGHDGGYADIEALASEGRNRVPEALHQRLPRQYGETISDEIERLKICHAASSQSLDQRLATSIEALIDGLTYLKLVQSAKSYEATRPAMAVREDAMKRRFQAARTLGSGKGGAHGACASSGEKRQSDWGGGRHRSWRRTRCIARPLHLNRVETEDTFRLDDLWRRLRFPTAK